MTENGHLKTYSLKLTTKSPVFIGNGDEYKKNDYVFERKSNTISVIDKNKFFTFLAKYNLTDKYENYLLVKCQKDSQKDMRSFFIDECRISDLKMRDLFRYSVSAGDALDENHSLKDIKAFVRNAKEEVYIPGSSIKGALRTAILFKMIQAEGKQHPDIILDRKENRSAWEYSYLSNLDFEKANNITKDIMRGVEVSDSLPVSNSAMIITNKTDVKIDGNTKKLNVCRECIKPGTSVMFSITFDESVLHGKMITADWILKAIRDFSDYYERNFAEKFRTPEKAGNFSYKNSLILGGGAGFFSKTLVYPYAGYDTALKKVTDYFKNDKQARKHHHEGDIDAGVSPHTLKYAPYGGKLYPYGLCEVSIE